VLLRNKVRPCEDAQQVGSSERAARRVAAAKHQSEADKSASCEMHTGHFRNNWFRLPQRNDPGQDDGQWLPVLGPLAKRRLQR
jgi:hypothetical protein